jgi:hypothetical protein
VGRAFESRRDYKTPLEYQAHHTETSVIAGFFLLRFTGINRNFRGKVAKHKSHISDIEDFAELDKSGCHAAILRTGGILIKDRISPWSQGIMREDRVNKSVRSLNLLLNSQIRSKLSGDFVSGYSVWL